jgi:hypothetical protein
LVTSGVTDAGVAASVDASDAIKSKCKCRPFLFATTESAYWRYQNCRANVLWASPDLVDTPHPSDNVRLADFCSSTFMHATSSAMIPKWVIFTLASCDKF